jgi:DNA-binding LacI/PurR family transcriptional regulator
MTVSNAYNRPDQLSEDTRQKVLRVARELGYPGPDPAARSLRRRQAGTVGVLLTERLPYAFADPGMLAFLNGVANELSEAGQALLLIPTESNAEHALVRNALVDGFVLASLTSSDPAVADVLARRLPVVTWGEPKLPGAPRVGVDNARAAAKAARHLAELGHRRIGVVTFGGESAGHVLAADSDADLVAAGADMSDAVSDAEGADGAADAAARGSHLAMRRRVVGFVRALRECGVEPGDVVMADAGRNSRIAGAAAARELLALGRRRPTAIFGVTDVLALGTLDAAAEANIEVPGQLSVVGFDDIAAAAASKPPLTTVSHSLFDQGRIAARAVLDLMAGREPVVPKIPSELIVRGSTAPPRKS